MGPIGELFNASSHSLLSNDNIYDSNNDMKLFILEMSRIVR